MISQETWVTTEEVASHLAKPVSWLYNNGQRLRIPRSRIGRCYRYRLSEVDQWLAEQCREGLVNVGG
jgi:predicted DNA-binding transcriptional regulator AlpA